MFSLAVMRNVGFPVNFKVKNNFWTSQGKLVAKVVLSIQPVFGYKRPTGCCVGKDKIWHGYLGFSMGLGKRKQRWRAFERAFFQLKVIHRRWKVFE